MAELRRNPPHNTNVIERWVNEYARAEQLAPGRMQRWIWFLFFDFVARHTKFGRYVYAIGGNAEAALAAAVIGGTSLFGGRGRVWAALLGALVIGSVSNGLDLIGQPADVKYMVEGGILLLAVTADALSRRGREAVRLLTDWRAGSSRLIEP
jgi:ribose/xylose/arabinose/galactoside ABC-type transport system permease subunit